MVLIPPDVPDEEAVYCCDMMSTGFMAAENAEIPIGGTVAVFALGPIGLMTVVGAKLRGAGLVIGVDSVPKRRELVRTYGPMRSLITPKKTQPLKSHSSRTEKGVVSAIEAFGGEQTFQNAIEVTKPGGTISNEGYHGKGDYVGIPRLDWGVGMAEKTIRTSLCPGDRLHMERLIRLLQTGRVDPTRMTTHKFEFHAHNRAFELTDKKLDGVLAERCVALAEPQNVGVFQRDPRRWMPTYDSGRVVIRRACCWNFRAIHERFRGAGQRISLRHFLPDRERAILRFRVEFHPHLLRG